MNKKYTVYIIRSTEGYKYTGMTEDIINRLKQHNDKSLSLWTKRGNNWKIIYFEDYTSKSAALKREKWLKTGAGRDYIKNILK